MVKIHFNITPYPLLLIVILLSISGEYLFAQEIAPIDIKSLVQEYKRSRKGPYKDIRWFCPDGSIVPPKDQCPDPGGHQHARYNDDVMALANQNHIFLGQILATTPYEDFWDSENRNSRLKQYQLERYLQVADNGWILKRAQYYRGARQIEDEEEWGLAFFQWLLKQDDVLTENYFLIREAAKSIPHHGDSPRAQVIRALSKNIGDNFEKFTYLRIKMHGQPDASDLQKVIMFNKKYRPRLADSLRIDMDHLIEEMQLYYQENNLISLGKYIESLGQNHSIGQSYTYLVDNYGQERMAAGKLFEIVNLLVETRTQLSLSTQSSNKLDLLNFSIGLEQILIKEVNHWQPINIKNLLLKTYLLARAAVACGYIEPWEWDKSKNAFKVTRKSSIELDHLLDLHRQSNAWVDWGSGMIRGTFQEVIDLYATFEPMATGMIDDHIRSSILLHLGLCVQEMGEFITDHGELSNNVLGIKGASQIRGLNPGYAQGRLYVIEGSPEQVQGSRNDIYIFRNATSELQPVAGIGTVSEGNPVSHIQLLARNLGIPNATFSRDQFNQLKQYNGSEVFYAVSHAGTVIMKAADDMNQEERSLFERKTRNQNRIHIPTDRIDLNTDKILNLQDIDASQSGIICGPKAANLAQLKKVFPNMVVDGLVLPFGIYRNHLDQQVPDQSHSYWEMITKSLADIHQMETSGLPDRVIEAYISSELERIRGHIHSIRFRPEFIAHLDEQFEQILGAPMGQVPVFVRSDTNMEDLKDFTGSGLNKTVFNVVNRDKILQGIKDVWASPFRERSYRWRQHYMLNPEHVYPSILIIPTVDVEYSGVIITQGISKGTKDDLTISFNLGAGGAVAGQDAESYLVQSDGPNVLLNPAREPYFRRLPSSGGSIMIPATFNKPILSDNDFEQIRSLTNRIQNKMPVHLGTDGPFDVELGFKDGQIWLFQIRPYVENENAKASTYLNSITPKSNQRISIPLNELIQIKTHAL